MLKTASQPFRIIIHAAVLFVACFITPAYGEISRGENHLVIDGRANQDQIAFRLCRSMLKDRCRSFPTQIRHKSRVLPTKSRPASDQSHWRVLWC